MVLKKRLNEICADNGLNLSQFAAEIGVSYRTVQNYVAGISVPKGDFYALLHERFGASPNWILLGIGPKYLPGHGTLENTGKTTDGHALRPLASDMVTLPRLDIEGLTGHGSAVIPKDDASPFTLKPDGSDRHGLNADLLSVIAMAGNSMEPDLHDGDQLVVDRSSTDLAESGIYAIRFLDALYVKRIQQQPDGKVLLISKNDDYPPIELLQPVAEGVEVVGRIVASVHDWRSLNLRSI